jgi:hypothetical protein
MNKHFVSSIAIKCATDPINDWTPTDEFSLINQGWGAWFSVFFKNTHQAGLFRGQQ